MSGWSVPDVEELEAHTNTDQQWVPMTLRAIDEMTGDRATAVPHPDRSWIDLSPFEVDELGLSRAYLHLVASATDLQTWNAMDTAAGALA